MMSAEQLVSIIIPVYNSKHYLEESIDSVLNQTYKDTEIIIVDDGSTDGSSEICDRYAEPDSRVSVIHQENRGLSAAWNVGIEAATGELITFLDSDDFMSPHMIDRCVFLMNREDVDIVITRHATFHGERHGIGYITKKQPLGWLPVSGRHSGSNVTRHMVKGKVSTSTWGKLYKRRLWDGIKFPEGQVYEDIETIPKVAEKAANVFITDDALMVYRKHSGSITATRSDDNFNDHEKAYRHLLKYVTENRSGFFDADDVKELHNRWAKSREFRFGRL